MRRGRRILVTGANGFVGQALCTALEVQGDRVIRATREAVGAIGPGTDWRPLLLGIDSVVHLAARAHVMNDTAADPLAEYRHINTEGTRHLAEQAAASGVRRMVYLSTVKVHGEATQGTPFRADDPLSPSDPYGVSKMEAEECLGDIGARTGLETVILRPPLVYGPRVRANFLALMHLCNRGLPLPLGRIDNRRSLVYLGNLVRAIRLVLDHPAAAGGTYLISDGEDLSTADLVRKIAKVLGRPARLVPLPTPFLTLAGRATGKQDRVARLLQSLTIDHGKLTADLNWTPPFTVDQGLAEVAAWYRRTHG
ncbi:SDR family oxidoreductase [Magnetospira sp. QH-2]|uniref:UDP-glucose 4-epimerase family protein n=1 Tax=Magnetospira sp. (strain QH-2) TaxID=1288970 RepID=UPI0003E80ED8|nr:SDR family oxidoreductase [Magnetospira sp. QH-2]CCQ75453.1 putative UDP-glucose 4-epimerase [Magnetospira sp. QH-2]